LTQLINASSNLAALAQWGNVLAKTSPIAILFGVSLIIDSIGKIDNQSTVVYCLLAGTIITLVWLAIDQLWNKEDNFVLMELCNKGRDIDAEVQSAISDGLTSCRLLSEFVAGEDVETLQAHTIINSIAYKAFVPSIYKNHHCKDMAKCKDIKEHFDKKSREILKVFNANSYHINFLNILKKQLPASVTVPTAIESYTYNVYYEIILPALLVACTDKINYYKSLIKRGTISRRLVALLNDRITRNEGYIEMIEQAIRSSTIVHKSAILSAHGVI